MAPAEKRQFLWVVAFFTAVSVALFFPALFLGKLIYGYDLITQTIPFHVEVQRSLAAHQWPLWMPDVLGGMPGIASCTVWFLYPTDLIGFLSGLPLPLQLALNAGLHVALAGVGMYLFLRRLDRSFSAALLGAFFFALSGSKISQLYGGYHNFVEGITWLPWAFWAAHKGCKENSRFAWGLCGLAFALQILAGAAQLCAYTLAATALFVLAEVWDARRANGPPATPSTRTAKGLQAARGLGLALGLAFLLAAPQLWLTLQYLPYSARQGWSYSDFIAGSIRPSEALTWIVPGYFGWQSPCYHGAMANCFTSEYFGLLPWTLALGALFGLWRTEATVRWMVALALGAFFFAQAAWTPFYPLFHRLPIVSGFRIWYRTLFLLTFAVCTLSAYGWDALNTRGTRASALRGAVVFLGLTLAAAALAWGLAPRQSDADAYQVIQRGYHVGVGPLTQELIALARESVRTTLALAAALLALLAFWRGRKNVGVALAVALVFHAVDQAQVIERFVKFVDPGTAIDKPHFLQTPPSPAGPEPWRVDDEKLIVPNNDVLLGYENLKGRSSVPLQSYQRTLDALKSRPGEWRDLMNERYIFSHSNIFGSLQAEDRVTIYQNPDVFPRAWLVGKSLRVSGDSESYRLLADPGFNPRDEVAVPADLRLAGAPVHGSVLWLARSPQAFSLDVSTDKPAALVLSNFWYPSWVAEVDGRETPILKADGGLQAIALSKGEHGVDVRFDPALFYRALAACLAGLIFLAGLAWMDDAP